MRIEFRAAWLALLARRTVAGLAGPANPHDRCGLANPETGCCLSCRRARQRGVDYAITQILAVGSRHASPPSLSRQRTRIIHAICDSRPESKISEPALGSQVILSTKCSETFEATGPVHHPKLLYNLNPIIDPMGGDDPRPIADRVLAEMERRRSEAE